MKVNPGAIVVEAASPIFVDDPAAIKGKSVLVIEDGPTLTHGEMAYGAGVVAARRFGAAEIIDPRPYAVGSIAATYQKYPTTGAVLPAMGYGPEQMRELGETINNTPCDLVSGRHSDRSAARRRDQSPVAARALRVAGDRPADAGRDPRGEVWTQEVMSDE